MNGKRTWEEAVSWMKNEPAYVDLVQACFYDDPLIDAANRFYLGIEWQAIKKLLPSPAKVLDLGAGRGIASYAFAKDGWEVTALEPDQSALVGANAIRALAKQAGLSINVEESWGEALPFPDESFEVVHARQVLHHARDLEQLCKEVSRVLKPNGLLIATREHVISKEEDLPIFLRTHPLHRLYGGENAYLLREYLSAIKNAGLRMDYVFNPCESDINLYPDSVINMKKRIAGKFGIPASLVPTVILKLRGYVDNTPGRLYTFLAKKG